jgi:hypothetical protein
MKLTKSKLKQIIKEELEYVGSEIENISDEDVLYTAEPSRWNQEGVSPEERFLHTLWMNDEIYPKLAAMGDTTEEVAEKLGVEDPEVIRIIDHVMRMKQERDRLKQQVKDYLEGRSDFYPYPD